MTLSSTQLAELDRFLVELNHAAAQAILPLFRAESGVVDKGGAKGFDPVTEADKGAERAIRALIAERFPTHGVIGEEYGSDRPDAEFVWVLDPVDGTRAFISGLPLWTTLIALRHQGRPVLGSIAQPYLDEIYIGHAGGSRLIGRGVERALKVRACPGLAQATVGLTDPEAYFTDEEIAAWRRLRPLARLIRMGCDSYAFAMVAAGSMDIAIEASLQAWDIEAAIPVVQGAGGFATDWLGQPVGPNGGRIVLAGDRACLEETLAALSS